ncbi:hypothetical protein ACFV4K_11165 [Nocardia sp. NPDC059764]|uniref:hypothetical protein n=1 Tax=Nocardia sp. NPDC059764 TaxID=3346939 RepID=UPI00365CAB79
MDFLDRHIADRVALAMREAGVGLGQIIARTGLSATSLAAEMGAIAPFSVADLVLVACALGREPAELLPTSAHVDSEVA